MPSSNVAHFAFTFEAGNEKPAERKDYIGSWGKKNGLSGLKRSNRCAGVEIRQGKMRHHECEDEGLTRHMLLRS